MHIDSLSTFEIVRIMNDEDKKVAVAVEKKLYEIANAADLVASALEAGGRLFYTGSGTSGRLGVLDAAECPPTFGTSPSQIQGLIAGGKSAMFEAQEGAEDDEHQGFLDLEAKDLTPNDIVCGLAASGRTPYVLGTLKKAIEIGCKTILVTCVDRINLNLPIVPNVIIDPKVGPEVIMGSTRLKSATAQKLICNMITTAAMVRLGKVYENVMVDLQLTNQKLTERAKRIIMMFSSLSYTEAERILSDADDHVKTAIIMSLTDISKEEALLALKNNNGFIKPALDYLSKNS